MAVKKDPATLRFGRTAVMIVAIGAAGLAGASLDAKFIGAGTTATVRLLDGKTFEAHPGTSSIEFACH